MKPVLRSSRQAQIQAKVQAEIERVRAAAKKQQPSGFNERRTAVRVAVNFPATYGRRAALKSPGSAATSPAVVTDISRSGLRLLTREPLTIGITVDLEITFGAGFAPSVLHVDARVIRLTAENERGYEYGLKLGADPVGRSAMGAAVLALTLGAARTGRH